VQTAVVQTLLALGNRQSPVILAGRVGVGKSTVAALVARSFMAWSWFACDDLLTTLMDCRQHGSVQRWDAQGYAVHTTEQQMLRRLEQIGILVLDDVGTRQLSEAQTEALRAVLDCRVRKPLLVTTNCTSEQLQASVGARNTSRLLAGAVVKIAGSDRRREMALTPPKSAPGSSPKMGGTDRHEQHT
jgi:DNA replication protein DnaC